MTGFLVAVVGLTVAGLLFIGTAWSFGAFLVWLLGA